MSDVEQNRLKNFPVNFLAVLLGLMGYSLALQKAESIIYFPLSGDRGFFTGQIVFQDQILYILVGIYLSDCRFYGRNDTALS